MGDLEWCQVVPPERVELSSLAPEASTLSTELQGLAHVRISWADRANKLPPEAGGGGHDAKVDKPTARR